MKMKMKIAKMVVLTAMLCLMPITGAAAYSDFVLDDDIIIMYNGTEENVVVPAQINGVEISAIDADAFFNNNHIKTVTIEEGIEVIKGYAFNNCDNLEEVYCPKSLLLICDRAFYNCDNLTYIDVYDETDIMEPSDIGPISMWTLDAEAEEGASEEKPEFVAADGVLTEYNGSAATVEIPAEIDGVEIYKIGDNAFKGNTTIETVIFPESITSIGDCAFQDCTLLTNVTLPNNLNSVGKYAFSRCNVASITIPGSLKIMANYMFYNCKNLKSVVLEEGVENTQDHTFENCSELQQITIPSTLKVFNTWVFGYCAKLSYVYIPKGATTLGSSAFYGCKKLNNITIPDTVTSIGTHCFRGCAELKNITLSNSVEDLPFNCFKGCGFENIIVPSSVKTISKEAFSTCRNLKAIDIPESVTTVGELAFDCCFSLESMILPNSIQSIGQNLLGTNSTKLKCIYYKGTQSEWNNITINSTNTNLNKLYIVKRYPFWVGADIAGYSISEDNKITASINLYYIPKNFTLLMAVYSGNNMIDMTLANVSPQATQAELCCRLPNSNLDDCYVKLLMFEDLENINPIGYCATKSITMP